MTLQFIPFKPEDQEPVKTLILQGMEDHWGFIDPCLNPDLNDIASSYRNAFFYTACENGHILATGALVPRSEVEAEIVRMSVARHARRQGIGKQMLQHLLDLARQKGFRRIILETTASWQEVIAFYLDAGFSTTHEKDGDVYFALDIQGTP